VDLFVDVADAGTHQVELRYASVEDASRSLSVNGGASVALQFPASGSYTRYETVRTELQLPRGRSTLTLRLTTRDGGSGYVNLDRLDVLTR
jgi:hypothetical protein